jgi:hypothetical protein
MTTPSSDPETAAGDLLAAALTLVEHGLPVFPVKPRSKIPATLDGFKSATVDPDQLRAWWGRWPDANIGVPTGAASGFVVLDVDARHGGVASFEKLRDQHRLPKTAQVLTGSGGFHYWFRCVGELRNSAGLLGDGLDVRGDGGYVVVPPSVHESGNPYEWLRELDQAAEWPAALVADAEKRSNGAAAKVAEIIPEGKRRAAMLTIAGKLKRSGLSGVEILPTLRELNKRRARARERRLQEHNRAWQRHGDIYRPGRHASTRRRGPGGVSVVASPARPRRRTRHLRRRRREPHPELRPHLADPRRRRRQRQDGKPQRHQPARRNTRRRHLDGGKSAQRHAT